MLFLKELPIFTLSYRFQNEKYDTMRSGSLIRLLLAGLVGRAAATASPSPVQRDAILDGEHFRMGLLAPRQNLQAFSGALGGVRASAITNSGDPQRPFGVDGDTFPDFKTAANRACDNQFNQCADAANSKTGNFAVGDCDRQTVQCKAFAEQTPDATFPAPALVSSNAEFDFFCDV